MSALSISAPAGADELSVDAPLLDQKDIKVNQQIHSLEKNGTLTNYQAAIMQSRRQNIMRDANNRRKRNNGILPTADVRELANKLDSMSTQINKWQ